MLRRTAGTRLPGRICAHRIVYASERTLLKFYPRLFKLVGVSLATSEACFIWSTALPLMEIFAILGHFRLERLTRKR